MNSCIYLRPLTLDDAKVSYKWRNNPEIWKHSKFDPPYPITLSMEMNWLRDALIRKDQLRFAICLQESNTYIGNVQLINISDYDAEFHLFIGETSWWGKGIGRMSTELLLKHAFEEMKLQKIKLEVHSDNTAAITIYKDQGFEYKECNYPFYLMELTHSNYKIYQARNYEKSYHVRAK